MAGGITEKGVLAFGITTAFATAATITFMDTHDLATSATLAGAAVVVTTGGAATAWAGGYSVGKLLNSVFKTEKFDDILGRVAGYGAGLVIAFAVASGLAKTLDLSKVSIEPSQFSPAPSDYLTKRVGAYAFEMRSGHEMCAAGTNIASMCADFQSQELKTTTGSGFFKIALPPVPFSKLDAGQKSFVDLAKQAGCAISDGVQKGTIPAAPKDQGYARDFAASFCK